MNNFDAGYSQMCVKNEFERNLSEMNGCLAWTAYEYVALYL